MGGTTEQSPQWVDAVLSWPGTWFAARIGVTSAYVLGELTKLSDFPATVAEQEQFGLNPGWLWASLAILVELGGSALVNSGYLVWLGVGLGVTTAIATLVANRFWAVSSHTRLHAANTFFEHIGLIVGLVLVPDCGRSESHQLAPAWAPLRTMSDRWSSDFVTLGARKMRVINALALATLLLATAGGTSMARDKPATATTAVAVGPQYDTAHVYVAPADMDRFSDSLIATFGGTKSQQTALTVTPTPSKTNWEAVYTPVGTFSVFGFTTPVPYPFGVERTGYLVTDMDTAIQSAKAKGADIVVAPFKDQYGRDAIVQWPGGVYMQLYWHTTAPNYAKLDTTPENRVYVSPDRADAFVRAFVGFSQGKVVSDDRNAPGIEIGRPKDTYRRVRIDSTFGKIAVLVTDGQLPYPYGREVSGYQVANLADAVSKAKAAGATVLVDPYTADGRQAAILSFPGNYIAEIHAPAGN